MKKMAEKIAESELEILKVLWDFDRPANLKEIRTELEKNSDWQASTIKTLLSRLNKKGVIDIEKRELYYYKPLITAEQFNEHQTQKIIDKLYGGSTKNLIASLVHKNKLNNNDIEELRDLLKELQK